MKSRFFLSLFLTLFQRTMFKVMMTYWRKKNIEKKHSKTPIPTSFHSKKIHYIYLSAVMIVSQSKSTTIPPPKKINELLPRWSHYPCCPAAPKKKFPISESRSEATIKAYIAYFDFQILYFRSYTVNCTLSHSAKNLSTPLAPQQFTYKQDKPILWYVFFPRRKKLFRTLSRYS